VQPALYCAAPPVSVARACCSRVGVGLPPPAVTNCAPVLLPSCGAMQGLPHPPSFRHHGTLLSCWSPPKPPPLHRFSPPREDCMPKHLPLALLDLLYAAGDRRTTARARFRPSAAAATTFTVSSTHTWCFLDLRFSPHSSRFPGALGPSLCHRRSPEHAAVEKLPQRQPQFALCRRPVPPVSPHPQNIAT
jgi:hypothetical protein